MEKSKNKPNEKKKREIKSAANEESVRRSTNQFKKLERGTQTYIGYYKVRDNTNI